MSTPEEQFSEAPDPGSTSEPERPDYLDAKFSSLEDQAKAYKESEKRMKRATQEAAEANQRAQLMEQQGYQLAERLQYVERQQASQQQQGANPMVVTFEKAMEEGDYNTALGVQAALAQQAAQIAVGQAIQHIQPTGGSTPGDHQQFALLVEDQVAKRYGEEWPEIRDQIGETLTEKPWLLPNTDDPRVAIEALSDIADNVRARKQAGQYQAANQQSEHARLMKQQAQGLTGQGARTVESADLTAIVKKRLAAVPNYGYGNTT